MSQNIGKDGRIYPRSTDGTHNAGSLPADPTAAMASPITVNGVGANAHEAMETGQWKGFFGALLDTNPTATDDLSEKASRVQANIEDYQRTQRSDEDSVNYSVLADYVADVLHYAHRHNIDVEQVLRLAQNHYYEETQEAEDIEREERITLLREAAAGRLDDEHSGAYADGYDEDDINIVLAEIHEASDVELACLWDTNDEYGYSGHSQWLIVDRTNGAIPVLREPNVDVHGWAADGSITTEELIQGLQRDATTAPAAERGMNVFIDEGFGYNWVRIPRG